ncbi:MAG TPA: DUF6150 family protein, partial [Gammaproteobacteria bacterium]|nr:DUF6150 family protein [Gammaproteobacteria bacterium]
RRDAVRNEGCWCFVDSMMDSPVTVHFLDNRAGSDFLICYVDTRGEAGWRTEHPYAGKLL